MGFLRAPDRGDRGAGNRGGKLGDSIGTTAIRSSTREASVQHRQRADGTGQGAARPAGTRGRCSPGAHSSAGTGGDPAKCCGQEGNAFSS